VRDRGGSEALLELQEQGTAGKGRGPRWHPDSAGCEGLTPTTAHSTAIWPPALNPSRRVGDSGRGGGAGFHVGPHQAWALNAVSAPRDPLVRVLSVPFAAFGALLEVMDRCPQRGDLCGLQPPASRPLALRSLQTQSLFPGARRKPPAALALPAPPPPTAPRPGLGAGISDQRRGAPTPSVFAVSPGTLAVEMARALFVERRPFYLIPYAFILIPHITVNL
jgi:hypothetical protein